LLSQRGKTLYRCYLPTYPELEKLARQAGWQILRSAPESAYSLPVKFFSRNICLLVRKGD
jgi:tRNA (uracil-5-)-methyltransferase TRM9